MSDLQKYVDGEVTKISPLKEKSVALQKQADALEVSDNKTLKEAVDIKKDITKHATAVKNLRLDITRQFDDVKSQFIAAEKDVLAPADEAKDTITNKIVDFEREQERLRQVEARRIEAIIASFDTNVRSLRSMKKVDERGAELKEAFSKLAKPDQDNPQIKMAFTVVINSLLERKEEIRTAEVDEAEQEKAAAARREAQVAAQEELDKAERVAERNEKSAPKTGLKTVTRFTITDPNLVPRELCVPSDQLIRQAYREGMKTIPGVAITQERGF